HVTGVQTCALPISRAGPRALPDADPSLDLGPARTERGARRAQFRRRGGKGRVEGDPPLETAASAAQSARWAVRAQESRAIPRRARMARYAGLTEYRMSSCTRRSTGTELELSSAARTKARAFSRSCATMRPARSTVRSMAATKRLRSSAAPDARSLLTTRVR